jgi:hypothetical protein
MASGAPASFNSYRNSGDETMMVPAAARRLSIAL